MFEPQSQTNISQTKRYLLVNSDSDRSENGDDKILGKLRDPLKANLSWNRRRRRKKNRRQIVLLLKSPCGFHTSYRVEISAVE